MSGVWRSISTTTAVRLWSAASSLLLLALTARTLGPDGRGIIAAATAWTLLFSTVAFLSLGQVALHLAAREQGEAWLPPVLGTLVAVTVVASALGWTVAYTAYAATGGELFTPLTGTTLALAFLALPLFIWEQYGSSLLMGINRLDVYNRAVVVGRSAALVLAAAALALDAGVNGVLVAVALGQAVVALRGIRHLLTAAERRPRPSRATARTLLSGGARLHANAVGAFLLTYTGVLAMSHYRGAVETGIYQLSTALLSAVLIVPQAAAWVMYARLSDTGADSAWAVHRRVLAGVSAIALAIGIAAAAASPLVVPAVAGPGFEDAAGLLALLLLSVPGLTWSAVMAPQWVTRGLFLQVSAITVGLGLVHLAGTLVLVPRHGAHGAAWATIGTSVAVLAVNAWMVTHCEREWRREHAVT